MNKTASTSATGGGELLTLQEVAAWLRIPESTLYRWRCRGEGPPGIKIGRHVRYRRADIDAYLNACTRGPRRKG